METKICKCCGRELSLDHFKRGRYGYVSVCLDCDKKHRAEKRQQRLDEQKRKSRMFVPRIASCAFQILNPVN